MSCARRWWRIVIDYPLNWWPHGWKRSDMRARYWAGADLSGQTRIRMTYKGKL